MAEEAQPERPLVNKLTLAMNSSSAAVAGVSLSTANRVIASVALDLLQEIYAKLMDKTNTEAEAHVRALYESYYAKYMAETQAAIDEMEGVAPED